MLLMVGCADKDVSPSTTDDTNHNLEAKIIKLEQIIEKQQKVIEEYEKKLTPLDELESLNDTINFLQESSFTLDNKLYMLDTLIKQTTSSKTAMINDATIQGNTIHLNVTYTNMIEGDEEGPSGFRLEETEEGTEVITLSKDVPVFKLIDPGTLVQATLDEIHDFRGFVQLFEKDGETVFISELYLP